MNADDAVRHACRLLSQAEMETDRMLMERYGQLADSWLSLADLLRANDDWTVDAEVGT